MMNRYHQHSAETTSSSSSGLIRTGDLPNPRRPLCHSNPGSGEGERCRTGESTVIERPLATPVEGKYSPSGMDYRTGFSLTISNPVTSMDSAGGQLRKPLDYLPNVIKISERMGHENSEKFGGTSFKVESRSPQNASPGQISTKADRDHQPQRASQSEDESQYKSTYLDKPSRMTPTSAKKSYRTKNRDFLPDSSNKSAGRSRNRFKHQNSSPMVSRSRTPHERRTSPYISSDTSFLSTLTASRPNAATGLLGVASAALAAARAGTLSIGPHTIDEPPRPPYENTTMMDKQYSAIHHLPHTTVFIPCHCQHQVCTYQQPHIFQPQTRDHLVPIRSHRRNSDSILDGITNREPSSAVHVIMCSHCKPTRSAWPKPIPTGPCVLCRQDVCTCGSYTQLPSIDRKSSFNETSGLDQSRPYLHSSWVALSGNECPEFLPIQPDTNRATSTAVLTELFTDFETCPSVYCDPNFYEPDAFQPFVGTSHLRYPHQAFGHKANRERVRSTSRDGRNPAQPAYYTSGCNRMKTRGLDSIGLDFMRINGARPGLLQLRHVKEFKAAKESEQRREVRKEQSQDISNKPRGKQTSVGKGSGALGLLVHGQQGNQQNPFHQLISGGVLGATVLAMAGKERTNSAKESDKASTSAKHPPDSTPVSTKVDESRTPWTENEINTSDSDVRPEGKQSSIGASLARLYDHSTIGNNVNYSNDNAQSGSKLSVKGFDSVGRKSEQYLNRDSLSPRSGTNSSNAMTSRLIKLRHKLTRSVTVAHSSEANKSQMRSMNKGCSVVSLQGTLSAPGLSRSLTQEQEEQRTGDEGEDEDDARLTMKPDRSTPPGLIALSDMKSSSATRVRIAHDQRGQTYGSLGERCTTDGSVLEINVQHPLRNSCDSVGLMESGSAKSKRYFTSQHVPILNDSGPTGSSTLTGQPQAISCSVNSLSRAKRRRDNFQKGRSSAFTWIPSNTIGERSEIPSDQEPICPSETTSGLEKKLSVVSNATQSSCTKIPDVLILGHSETRQEGSVKEPSYTTRKLFESSQNYSVTGRVNSSEPLVNNAINRKRSSDIPLLQVEDFNQVEDSAAEISQLQRRRDAMNNQHQQRTIRNVGYRLGRRKRLFEKRCRISDFSLTFALFGIFVMLVETELTFAGVYRKDSIYSYFAKSLISISTLLLLGLILAYHVYVIKIFSSDDSIEDWRMAVDCNRIGQMALELFVCLIHPFPGCDAIQFPISPSYVGPLTEFHPYIFSASARSVESDLVESVSPLNRSTVLNKSLPPSTGVYNPGNTSPSSSSSLVGSMPGSWMNTTSGYTFYPYKIISVDLILSVPMFLRLYLLFRTMLLHSKLFTDAGSRSIGAMNKVNFDMRFIFKTLMTMCPGRLLLGFILCLWVIYSWSLRACESFYEKEHGNLLNSMWLIAVTFLSIGYGDIVPHTYCGRAIALATGVMGSGCTALIVAVFARKLELSKAEKHVIHFMMENQLNKKVKNYAANVLRETWLIYKYTKLAKRVDATKVRTHQRKFLRAIHGLRRMKLDQRKVQDSANTLVDLAKTQTNIYETVSDLRMEQNCLNHRMEALETTLLKLQDQLRALPSLLRTTLIQQHYAYQKYSSTRNTDSVSAQNPQISVDHK